MKIGLRTIGRPKKIGSLIWNTCVGSDSRATLRYAESLERQSRSASARVAPVPPTFTNVVKKPYAVTNGGDCPPLTASVLAARYWRKIGATTASTALSPLIPTDHSIVTSSA